MLFLLPATSHKSGVPKQEDPESQQFISSLKASLAFTELPQLNTEIYLNTSSCKQKKEKTVTAIKQEDMKTYRAVEVWLHRSMHVTIF
jgi:hypothetical protein